MKMGRGGGLLFDNVCGHTIMNNYENKFIMLFLSRVRERKRKFTNIIFQGCLCCCRDSPLSPLWSSRNYTKATTYR